MARSAVPWSWHWGWGMLSVKQAAARATVSIALIYELCACGALACLRLGRPGRRGCIRIMEADLEAFLASRKVAAPTRAPPPPAKRQFKHVRIPQGRTPA